MFSGRCYEGLEIGIEGKRDGKHVLNFIVFQNVFAFFRICDGLSWMVTAFGEMILETVFPSKKDAGSTDKRMFYVRDMSYHIRAEKDS